MGVIKDTKASFERIPSYASQIKNLLLRHGIHNVDDLKRVAKEPTFKREIAALWEDILKSEGGKLTVTLVLSTIALVMGSVGIATGGGAIGLPLLLVLAPAGFIGGQELDSEGYSKKIVERFKKFF